MWHEARKQERKIRGMIVDYRKRAERRQDFYERITALQKSDPAQFLQIYGRQCKIHLDPAIAAAGDGASIIVPWQGHADNLIDRFDVRAHLDHIDPAPQRDEWSNLSSEERHCNYERYRILAQNEFLGITEDKFLHQLHLDEKFGANAHSEFDKETSKKKPSSGAAINFSYDDAGSTYKPVQPSQSSEGQIVETDSDLDMDVSVDISKLDTYQAHEINACGRNYGMMSNDFYSYLTKDADEADALKIAREEEREKLVLSGRKSRRERRAQREKRFCSRPLSPPSYAAKEDKNVADSSKVDQESDSRSTSPETTEKITFITSFGGEDELRPHSKISININKRNVGNKSSLDTKLAYNKHANTRVSHRTDEISPRSRRSNTQKTDSTRKHLKTRSRSNSPVDHRYRKSPHKSQPERSMSSYGGEVEKDLHPKAIASQRQSSVTSSERNHLVTANTEKDSISSKIATPVKRYYGRKRDDSSSDDDTNSESSAVESTNSTHSTKPEDQDITTSEHSGKIPSSVKSQDAAGKSLRERLKRKMQLLLNKQYKADKRAEIERTERQMQQQQERQDEMRDLALKLRKRQRELRHKYGTSNRSSYSSSSSSSEERISSAKKERSNSPGEYSSRRNRDDHIYRQSELSSHGSFSSRGTHTYESSNSRSLQEDKRQTDYQREHSRYAKSHRKVHSSEDRDYERSEYRDYSRKDGAKEKLHSRDRERNHESSRSRIVDY